MVKNRKSLKRKVYVKSTDTSNKSTDTSNKSMKPAIIVTILCLIIGGIIIFNAAKFDTKIMRTEIIFGTSMLFLWNYTSFVYDIYKYISENTNNVIGLIFNSGGHFLTSTSALSILLFYILKIKEPLYMGEKLTFIVVLIIVIVILGSV